MEHHVHQVQVATELDTRVNLLLLLHNGLDLLFALLTLSRLDATTRRRIHTRSHALGTILLQRVAVAVRVSMLASTPRRDAQTLVHGHKRHEANHDGQAQDQVAVGLDEHKLGALRVVLADKDLGQQVEERVTEQAADGKRDHDGQVRGVNVGRAQGEQEVGRAGDVERREEGVDGGGAREQHGEEARRQRRGLGVVVRLLGGVEVLHDGTSLQAKEKNKNQLAGSFCRGFIHCPSYVCPPASGVSCHCATTASPRPLCSQFFILLFV